MCFAAGRFKSTPKRRVMAKNTSRYIDVLGKEMKFMHVRKSSLKVEAFHDLCGIKCVRTAISNGGGEIYDTNLANFRRKRWRNMIITFRFRRENCFQFSLIRNNFAPGKVQLFNIVLRPNDHSGSSNSSHTLPSR